MKKNTDALQQELMETISLDQFLKDNQDQFQSDTVAQALLDLCRKKKDLKGHAGKSSLYQ